MINDHLIFIDFDGTITYDDVGYVLFKKFTDARTEPIVQEYRKGKINSRNCLYEECMIWNENPQDPEEVYEHLDSRKLSPGINEFLKLIREKSIEPVILSEGFSFYIERILNTNNLDNLILISNIAKFTDGKVYPEFPYFELGCGQCSNCKGYHISTKRNQWQSVIFIGDGHSDHHASGESDIIFAKSFLSEHLKNNDKYHFTYDCFDDIIPVVSNIIDRGVFLTGNDVDLCLVRSKHHDSLKKFWETGEVMKYVGFPSGLGWSEPKYEKYFKDLNTSDKMLVLVIEDHKGQFMGQAKLGAPNNDGNCEHEVKLLPEFQGHGLGKKIWKMLIERSGRVWPDADLLVTPSVENKVALKLYESLGFKYDGEIIESDYIKGLPNMVPINYRRMLMIKK